MESVSKNGALSRYLDDIGVSQLPALTSPFDPGYDPVTLASHLQQSCHLMASIKISMACWLITDEGATRAKFSSAKQYGVPAATGGGPFEVAVAQGKLDDYLDLCADIGAVRVECGEGFTTLSRSPREIVALIESRGLEAQYEMGKKHEGPFTEQTLQETLDRAQEWLEAGAKQLVVEARESAADVGTFRADGSFNAVFADRIASRFGLDLLIFEAPNKFSQFAFLEHFGPLVKLGNVRLEELLRVEIFRRGLHSDAFQIEKLRPRRAQSFGSQ